MDELRTLLDADGGVAGPVRSARNAFDAGALADLPPDGRALAEKVVAVHAALFVRHPSSSFSSHVGDLRSAFYGGAHAAAIDVDLGDALVQRGIVRSEGSPPPPPPAVATTAATFGMAGADVVAAEAAEAARAAGHTTH